MKKELESRRRNKRKQKEQKREERKASSTKGKGFDAMIAYVDEFGKLSDTPLDPKERTEMKLEDIRIGGEKPPEDERQFINKGRVTYYNDEKSYGFIRDSRTREELFFHISNAAEPLKLNDHVVFEKVRGEKGMNAIKVQKSGL
jgi:cold shock CspA family protein